MPTGCRGVGHGGRRLRDAIERAFEEEEGNEITSAAVSMSSRARRRCSGWPSVRTPSWVALPSWRRRWRAWRSGWPPWTSRARRATLAPCAPARTPCSSASAASTTRSAPSRPRSTVRPRYPPRPQRSSATIRTRNSAKTSAWWALGRPPIENRLNVLQEFWSNSYSSCWTCQFSDAFRLGLTVFIQSFMLLARHLVMRTIGSAFNPSVSYPWPPTPPRIVSTRQWPPLPPHEPVHPTLQYWVFPPISSSIEVNE